MKNSVIIIIILLLIWAILMLADQVMEYYGIKQPPIPKKPLIKYEDAIVIWENGYFNGVNKMYHPDTFRVDSTNFAKTWNQ